MLTTRKCHWLVYFIVNGAKLFSPILPLSLDLSRGVPNTQLIKERPQFAGAYNNQAVAEQNSVDLAWLLVSANVVHFFMSNLLLLILALLADQCWEGFVKHFK